jgi:hypothetical protein
VSCELDGGSAGALELRRNLGRGGRAVAGELSNEWRSGGREGAAAARSSTRFGEFCVSSNLYLYYTCSTTIAKLENYYGVQSMENRDNR